MDWEGAGFHEALHIYALSGASPMQRLTYGGNNRFPVWTSNSRRIAFQSTAPDIQVVLNWFEELKRMPVR